MDSNRVRLDAFWDAVLARLTGDSDLLTRLGGTAAKPRVYLVTDDFSEPEALESAPWYRLVVVPTDSIWTQLNAGDPRVARRVGFLVRTEANDFRAKGYRAGKALDGIQARVYDLLYGWAPAAALSHAFVVRPLYLVTPEQPSPLWDEDRHLWYTSTQWQTEAVSPAGP